MPTYSPIESIEIGSNTQSVTFSNINQTYTDLVLVMNFQLTSYGVYNLKFNNNTTNLYSTTFLYGVTAGRTTSQTSMPFQQGFGPMTTTGNYQTGIITINNYSNSNIFKNVLYKTGNAATTGLYPGVEIMTGLWRNTEAINSITLDGGSNPFGAGSTFDLYGIKVGTPKAFGGNTVTTDGTYWYHTFTSSGTFSPMNTLSCDYLVVAGGGGSGGTDLNASLAAPGGGGGLRCTVGSTGGGGALESSLSLSASTYTVTVGGGGAGGSGYAHGSNGSNSVFASITSIGGGGGGYASSGPAQNGNSGGSGGGGNGGGANQFGTGGAGTTGQGYAGGNGNAFFGGGYAFGAGGGGGAGAAGSNGSDTAGGNGGIGVATSISGTSTYYAGGGGGGINANNTGGTGGLGGGGNGARTQGTPGTANTGGGAGGGGTAGSYNGNAGGSGIVIVRYPV